MRRRLARDAAPKGWSVRETERRAKQPAKRGGKGRGSADRDAALVGAEQELERGLGHDATIRIARNGVKAELVFDDLDELRAFARRLQSRPPGD